MKKCRVVCFNGKIQLKKPRTIDDHLLFYFLFNSIVDFSAGWLGDNERLYAVEPPLWFKRFLSPARLKLETTRSVGPCLI